MGQNVSPVGILVRQNLQLAPASRVSSGFGFLPILAPIAKKTIPSANSSNPAFSINGLTTVVFSSTPILRIITCFGRVLVIEDEKVGARCIRRDCEVVRNSHWIGKQDLARVSRLPLSEVRFIHYIHRYSLAVANLQRALRRNSPLQADGKERVV